jgi:8-oxo-dGTP pyrophosphatase MutT (NUDIX family)
MKYSAGIIITDMSSTALRVLCLRAYSNWDFPKGELEDGESYIDAAVRETEEETELLNGSDYNLTGDQTPGVIYGAGKNKKTAYYFLATRVSSKEPFLPISIKLGKPENDEYRWMSTTEMEETFPNRLKPFISWVKERVAKHAS